MTPTYHNIDPLETEEALCEYYDFSHTTTTQWQTIDRLTGQICTQRHIPTTNQTATLYDIYCDILDGICHQIGIPTR